MSSLFVSKMVRHLVVRRVYWFLLAVFWSWVIVFLNFRISLMLVLLWWEHLEPRGATGKVLSKQFSLTSHGNCASQKSCNDWSSTIEPVINIKLGTSRIHHIFKDFPHRTANPNIIRPNFLYKRHENQENWGRASEIDLCRSATEPRQSTIQTFTIFWYWARLLTNLRNLEHVGPSVKQKIEKNNAKILVQK